MELLKSSKYREGRSITTCTINDSPEEAIQGRLVVFLRDIVHSHVTKVGELGGQEFEVTAMIVRIPIFSDDCISYCSMHFSNRWTALKPRIEKMTAQA